jgi:hypothetical protein
MKMFVRAWQELMVDHLMFLDHFPYEYSDRLLEMNFSASLSEVVIE